MILILMFIFLITVFVLGPHSLMTLDNAMMLDYCCSFETLRWNCSATVLMTRKIICWIPPKHECTELNVDGPLKETLDGPVWVEHLGSHLGNAFTVNLRSCSSTSCQIIGAPTYGERFGLLGRCQSILI